MKLLFKSLFLTTTLLSLTAFGNAIADESHRGQETMGHSHEPVEVPQGQPIPQVDLVVHPDPMRGWNLEIQLSNFEFAPEMASKMAMPGQGHGHLYVNGEKVTRIYGNWYYLNNLVAGENQVQVTLNTNDHKALYYQGKPIEDTEVIRVP